LNSVTGVAFLGTPHQGGNGVNNAKFVANLVRAFKIDVRVDLLKSLDPKSMILFDLTNDFRQLVSSKGIEIASLFETRKTKVVGSSKILFFGQDIWVVPTILPRPCCAKYFIADCRRALSYFGGTAGTQGGDRC
jgi:hypothetical protein